MKRLCGLPLPYEHKRGKDQNKERKLIVASGGRQLLLCEGNCAGTLFLVSKELSSHPTTQPLSLPGTWAICGYASRGRPSAQTFLDTRIAGVMHKACWTKAALAAAWATAAHRARRGKNDAIASATWENYIHIHGHQAIMIPPPPAPL